jgi:hypothetical protein
MMYILTATPAGGCMMGATLGFVAVNPLSITGATSNGGFFVQREGDSNNHYLPFSTISRHLKNQRCKSF